ncbi:glycosyltransferase family 39 protein [Candidatus Curtissbacteria bacterium]|nr:glycosyltransferase family 39 protein [Candidatus Curtissbacteria bacterium]
MKKATDFPFWLVITPIYFLTRLLNLKIIPIFTDEAIYSYWAQVALHDPVNRFISLEDGKQPLFIWLAAVFQKFIADPLVAGRLVSTLAGFGSTVGIYLLAKDIFNKKVAKIASILYIILPFTLLYDRMALFDSLLTMLGIYAILFSIKLARDPRLDWAMLSGVAIGLAMITKSSGVFFLYLLPASLLLADLKKSPKAKILKWLPFALVTFIISQVAYNSLRLSPLFYIIARKNLEFVRSLSEVVADPFLYLTSNFSALTSWIITYMGIPLFAVLVIATVWGLLKRNIKVAYLALLTLVPFGAEAFFNKVLYPRFILFYFPYVILLTAFGINSLAQNFQMFKKYVVLFVLFALLVPSVSSFYLLTSPTRAKIATSDAGQYLNDWPAGYGVAEIVTFLKNAPEDRQIYVGTEGTFGLLPFGLQIYFFGQQNLHIIGFWPVNHNDLPTQILELAQDNPTYFVFNETQSEITNQHLKLVAKYQKGIGDSYMRLYEVLP